MIRNSFGNTDPLDTLDAKYERLLAEHRNEERPKPRYRVKANSVHRQVAFHDG